MSYAGYGGVSLAGACVQAIGGLITGGINFAFACGHACKDLLDKRERAVGEQAKAYYRTYVQQIEATGDAIDAVAGSIIMQSYAPGTAASVTSAISMQQVEEQVRQELASLRQEVSQKTASEAQSFLQRYKQERAAESQQVRLARMRDQLRQRLESAQVVGITGELRNKIESTLQGLDRLSPKRAFERLRLNLEELNQAMSAATASATNVTTLRYGHVRGRQELEDSTLFIRRERLSANLDADVRAATAAAFTRAEELLAEATRDLDSNPAIAREAVEQAHTMVQHSMAAAREQARYGREVLRLDMEAAQAKLTTLEELLVEMQTMKIPLQGEARQIGELRANLNAITARMSDRTISAQELSQGARSVRQQGIALRAKLESKLATAQRKIVVANIEETLRSMGFSAPTASSMSVEMSGGWTVTGYGQATAGKGKSKVTHENKEKITLDVVEGADGGIVITYDLAGFVGTKCIDVKNTLFSELRKRGITIQEKSGISFNGHVHQAAIEKLIRIFEKIGFGEIRMRDIGGDVIIEAFNGPTGYTVNLTSDGETSALFTQGSHSSHKSLEEIERLGGQTPGLQEEIREKTQKTQARKRPVRQQVGN